MALAVLSIVQTQGSFARADRLWPPYGEPYKSEKVDVYPNTVRWELMRQAGFTSAQVFGAVGAFEKYILPSFGRETGFVAAFDYNVVLNAAKAIGTCGVGECDPLKSKVVVNHLDLYNSSFAIGAGGPNYGIFGTGSYSLSFVPGPVENRARSTYFTIMMPIFMYAFWWLRLFGKSAFSTVLPGSMDAVVGGYAKVGPVQGYGGYILSQGVFGDVSMPGFSPFGTVAVTDNFEQATLLKGGLRQFDYFGAQSLADTVGRTSLFARRLVLNPPRSLTGVSDPLDALSSGKDNLKVPLTTGHLEQLDILQYVDVRAAYAVKPTALLHEFRIGVHTPHYNAIQTRTRRQDGSLYDAGFTLSATAGMVEFPNLFYYGVQGGKRFAMSIEGGSVGPKFNFKLFVRYNDPELLTPFPYAYNAVSLGLVLSGAGLR